jgi:hypothetical protein
VRKALGTLPWVEQESIQVDIPRRELRFNLKEQDGFKEDEVKKALKDQGFAEVTVKTTRGR